MSVESPKKKRKTNSKDMLEEAMPFILEILEHARVKKNQEAQDAIEKSLRNLGFMGPECYKQAILSGWGSKHDGMYKICSTHFPDDDFVKGHYSKILQICE